MSADANGLRLRRGEFSDCVAIALKKREQANRLKKVEAPRLVPELLFEQRLTYRIGFSPALGGHCLSVPFRCRVRTTSWLKLLREA